MTKTQTMSQSIKKEVRMADINIANNSEEMIVEGYAAIYDTPTVIWEYDGIQYKEMIARGAFNGADMKDVCFKYNHAAEAMIMARTRNKTLSLIPDDKGLFIRAVLADTTTSRDLYTLIKRRDISQMSFAFRVKEEIYNKDERLRIINKFDYISDVSAVDFPAYEDTDINVRSYFETRHKEEEVFLKEHAELKKRLLLRTYL